MTDGRSARMPDRDLQREVTFERRRKIGVLIACVVAPQAALIAWLAWPADHVQTVHTSSIAIVALPTPIEIVREVRVPSEPRRCPLPRHDAARTAPAPLPEDATSLRPSSTNAGWIAAWNDNHVFISMDAGASWQRRFDGAGEIRDVDFDCFGRAIVVRGDQVGIRDGTREIWHAAPAQLSLAGDERAEILGGGPDVVIVGNSRRKDVSNANIAVSRDDGGTWEVRALPYYWESGRVIGRQHEDRKIVAMQPVADCSSDSPWVFTLHEGALQGEFMGLTTELAFFADRVVSSIGWQRTADDKIHTYDDVADYADYEAIVLEGPAPVLVHQQTAYRLLDSGTFAPLPWKISFEATMIVGDAAGRIWSLVCGQPYIATRAEPPTCVGN